ncbi:MAG: hypothetical protein FWE63_07320 [Bacteroidales bacterium]|nr:hypothetical protein [Bacteroidales bacterium]
MAKLKKIASFFLLMICVNYYVSTTFFLHSHEYPERTVTHSHAHKDCHHDTKGGGHTEKCIAVIDQISNLKYVIFSFGDVSAPLPFLLHQEKNVETTQRIKDVDFWNLSPLEPPSC